MKRKNICVVLCGCMLLLAAACGTAELTATPTDETVGTEAQQQTDTPDATEAPQQEEQTTAKLAVAPSNKGDITYTLKNATVISTKNTSCTEAEDGGLKLQFDGQWEMVRLMLPRGVDLSQCMYISVQKMLRYHLLW